MHPHNSCSDSRDDKEADVPLCTIRAHTPTSRTHTLQQNKQIRADWLTAGDSMQRTPLRRQRRMVHRRGRLSKNRPAGKRKGLQTFCLLKPSPTSSMLQTRQPPDCGAAKYLTDHSGHLQQRYFRLAIFPQTFFTELCSFWWRKGSLPSTNLIPQQKHTATKA